MFKAIIFDLDGTLLNTSADIYNTVNISLAKFSLPPITLNQTVEYVGNGAKKLIERAVGSRTDKLQEVYDDYVERFAKIENDRTELYPYEEDALNKFVAFGIKLALVSNKPQAATERVYAKFLSKFNFCIVLGHTEYTPLKPNPASVLHILDKLSLKKEDCVLVGDGETDVMTAKNCGIKCISALWGYRSVRQLQSAGADCFANNFKELEELILK